MQEASSFSVLKRPKTLKKLKTEVFDLIIIGGGITGAGIALDAVSRGLRVCLVEKNDFASGTSNKSTKLIHGGLRYLKQLEIGLVRESGQERAIVHKLAPHLVIPEKMLLPIIKGGTYGKMMTALGLKVYDYLANVQGPDSRRMLNKTETLQKESLLDETIVKGGGLYAEYRTDDARLTLEVLKKANRLGATIINYCEIESFNYGSTSKIDSLNCVDHITQGTFTIKAKHYVSAAGPWVDTLRKKDDSINKKYLHLTKGVHLVFPKSKLPVKQPVYFDTPDGRMVFAIPRGKTTYVGTTDTTYTGDLNRVVATKSDANYVVKAINNAFPNVNITINDISSNWAGLRPLIHEAGKSPSELSRKDELFISKSGLISIAGGKLTGYRKMAQRALDAVIKNMSQEDKRALKPSKTEQITLVTPTLSTNKDVNTYIKTLENTLKSLNINDPYYAWYLCTTYGKQADIIIDKYKIFTDIISSTERLIRSELWYCVHYEMTTNLADFFVRRTGRLYFNIESVVLYLDCILKDITLYLDWNTSTVQLERHRIDQLIVDATTYYDNDF